MKSLDDYNIIVYSIMLCFDSGRNMCLEHTMLCSFNMFSMSYSKTIGNIVIIIFLLLGGSCQSTTRSWTPNPSLVCLCDLLGLLGANIRPIVKCFVLCWHWTQMEIVPKGFIFNGRLHQFSPLNQYIASRKFYEL